MKTPNPKTPKASMDGPALDYGAAPVPELKPDLTAIRAEQKRDRERRTTRCKSKLP